MARRRRLHSLVAVACLVSVAGCGAGPKPSASPTPRPATASPLPTASPTPLLSAAPTDGSASSTFFSLPANWTEVELTEAAIQDRIARMRQQNPEMVSDALQFLPSDFASLSFYADAVENGELIGNLIVVQIPAAGATLDDLEPPLLAQLTRGPNYLDARSRRVSLPIGEALLLTSTLTFISASGSERVVGQHFYVLIDDGELSLVTFTCFEGSESCPGDVETIIQSFRP